MSFGSKHLKKLLLHTNTFYSQTIPSQQTSTAICKTSRRNTAISTIPPLTSCGVCLAGEWPGLVVEHCLPLELCSH